MAGISAPDKKSDGAPALDAKTFPEMIKGKKRVSGKSAQPPPSAQKKTPQRACKRAKTPPAAQEPIGDHEEHLDALAKKDADAKQLVDDIRAPGEWDDDNDKLFGTYLSNEPLELFLPDRPTHPAKTPTEADAARKKYSLRGPEPTIDDLILTLRTAIEPEMDLIPRLAEVIECACALLAESAQNAGTDQQDMLAEALLPAVRSAVTLTDFVNGPGAALSPRAHAQLREISKRWPRIHYADRGRNNQEAAEMKRMLVGGHRAAKQARTLPRPLAFERTLEAMRTLLPDALRLRFPVLPMLFDEEGKPVAPTNAAGKLSRPYLELARFIVSVRHAPVAYIDRRDKALRRLLEINTKALLVSKLPAKRIKPLGESYKRTAEILTKIVAAQGEGGPVAAPPWLRSSAPSFDSLKSWSKDREDILSAPRQRVMAKQLQTVYDAAVSASQSI